MNKKKSLKFPLIYTKLGEFYFMNARLNINKALAAQKCLNEIVKIIIHTKYL